MSKFQHDMFNDYEAQYGCRPAYWARFIDDVFFIWTGDEESLKAFLNFLTTIANPRTGSHLSGSPLRVRSNALSSWILLFTWKTINRSLFSETK